MTNNKEEEFQEAVRRARISSNVAPEEKTREDEFREDLYKAKAKAILTPDKDELRKREFQEALDKLPLAPSHYHVDEQVPQRPRQMPPRPVNSYMHSRPQIPVHETVQTPVAVQEEPKILEHQVEEVYQENKPSTITIDIPGVISGSDSQVISDNDKIEKKEVKSTTQITLEDIVDVPKIEKKEIKIVRYDGDIPDIHEFVELFHQLGVDGQNKAVCSTLLNAIAKRSMILYGPSAGGKTTIGDVMFSLLPPEVSKRFNDIKKGGLINNAEQFNDMILYFPEIQTLLRGMGEEKDAVRTIFEGIPYKSLDKEGNVIFLNPLFAMSAVAPTNPYWKNYISNDPETKSRLNIIYTDKSLDALIEHRNNSNIKRMGRNKKKKSELNAEDAKKFIASRMAMKIDSTIIDPSSAYVDSYIPLTHIANRYTKHYRAIEDVLIKWYNEEDKYEINGKEIFVFGLRNKYRAETIFRKDICEAIREFPNVEYAKEQLNWSEEEIARMELSLEKSKEDVDWQACWDSYLESLRESNAPPALIGEIINRHVVNGKITVIDPVTGEEVLLAQYPKPVEMPQNTEKTVVTDMKGAFDEYKTEEKGIEEKVSESKDESSETKFLDIKEVKNKNHPIYAFLGNVYDSMEEAACADMMNKYIPSFEPKEGETIHISEGLEGVIDYKVENVFVEYHPIALCRLDNGFGDFESKEEFKVYKKVRDSLPEEKRKEYDNDIKEALAKNYFNCRSLLIEISPTHQGTELIVATSPEEVYDKVISRFGENIPSKEEFLDEFEASKQLIKEGSLENGNS